MTSGFHAHPDKYIVDAWRTVRCFRADCPRGRCYIVPFLFFRSWFLDPVTCLFFFCQGSLSTQRFVTETKAIPAYLSFFLMEEIA